MLTIQEVNKNIKRDPENWRIYLMDFVDDFRATKDLSAIEKPFMLSNEKFDALLASTVTYLCNELNLKIPSWITDVPPCKTPWFVSEMNNLKAISIVESPLPFRMRKIFVLENFLNRV
ncbi:MAG: hypothetical protein ABII23_02675 [bacterium]